MHASTTKTQFSNFLAFSPSLTSSLHPFPLSQFLNDCLSCPSVPLLPSSGMSTPKWIVESKNPIFVVVSKLLGTGRLSWVLHRNGLYRCQRDLNTVFRAERQKFTHTRTHTHAHTYTQNPYNWTAALDSFNSHLYSECERDGAVLSYSSQVKWGQQC